MVKKINDIAVVGKIMKNYIKYIISTIAFFVVYSLLEYLFSEKIDWKMVITTTIIYAILNTGCYLIFNKKSK